MVSLRLSRIIVEPCAFQWLSMDILLFPRPSRSCNRVGIRIGSDQEEQITVLGSSLMENYYDRLTSIFSFLFKTPISVRLSTVDMMTESTFFQALQKKNSSYSFLLQ